MLKRGFEAKEREIGNRGGSVIQTSSFTLTPLLQTFVQKEECSDGKRKK
ncbi:hypothetical protein HMPREF1977_1916 [Capnocytophaga ochracea F0287]|uniref:Uncharacterized protein n=1 Tax=Capnocytophaga ochracea F0287 TaxID=873517 RepID=E4MU44_CAPOC|nr:hypothetical protein HMPREF1977_1916 [Capnocytophaga ochracea F0287]